MLKPMLVVEEDVQPIGDLIYLVDAELVEVFSKNSSSCQGTRSIFLKVIFN